MTPRKGGERWRIFHPPLPPLSQRPAYIEYIYILFNRVLAGRLATPPGGGSATFFRHLATFGRSGR